MKKQCVIIGAGTYGQVYAEYLKDIYEIIGFIDDDSQLNGVIINGYSVLGNYPFLKQSISKDVSVFVPIGNNDIRVRLLKDLSNNGFATPGFIHEETNINSSVKIGKAVYILPGTYIMPYTLLGNYIMISMGVNIAHHNRINDGCFFSQGTNIGASIEMGNNAFCGIGSTIMTGVKKIGQNSLIGAGAVVIKDVPDNAVVVGNPGRIIKWNTT